MDASTELLIYGLPSGSATRQMPSIPIDKCQPYSDSLLYCPAGKDFSEELWVRNVYPPIQVGAHFCLFLADWIILQFSSI